MTVTTYTYTTTYANGLETSEPTDFDSFEFDFECDEQALEAEFCPCEAI